MKNKNSASVVSRVSGLIEEGEAFRALSTTPATTATTAAVPQPTRERFDVIVIGGGQAGLSVGYHLKKLGIDFVIVDASARIGDAWRKRWDSLRLFSVNRYNGLDGMPFPGPADAFPTKDEMADYLESYASHFQLPVLSSVRVDRLSREGERYLVDARRSPLANGDGDGDGQGDLLHLEAEHVVIAMASYQGRKVPDFAKELSPEIVQLHTSEYKGLSQLKPGGVLVVGTANSGAEIATETVTAHPTWISGRDVGEVAFAFSIKSRWARLVFVWFLFRVLFHRILTVRTPIGRKVRAKALRVGSPRIRQRRADLVRNGVQWLDARTTGVKDGLPMLADGRTLEGVRNIIWCTGYDRALSWIDLPIFEETSGELRHNSGLALSEPGLYFVGQHFQHALSSTMIQGVGRDAERMVCAIKERCVPKRSAPTSRPARTGLLKAGASA